MIKHVVMWKLKDFAEGNDKETNKQIVKKNLEGLRGQIEGLLAIEVGVNYNSSGYDICLYSEFKDRAALDYYTDHPLHKKNLIFTRAVVCERASVDYEI